MPYSHASVARLSEKGKGPYRRSGRGLVEAGRPTMRGVVDRLAASEHLAGAGDDGGVFGLLGAVASAEVVEIPVLTEV